MDIYVRDRNLKVVDIVDDAQSVIWTKRFYECGDFEIYIIANEKNLQKFQQGYFLTREDDDTVMVIEHINITTDVENGNYLTITGRCAKSLLERRCMWNYSVMQSRADGSTRTIPQWLFYEALDNLCINSNIRLAGDNWDGYGPDLKRDISIISQSADYFLDVVRTKGVSTKSIYNYNYIDSFLNILIEQCKSVYIGFGFILITEGNENKLALQAVQPNDRSQDQTILPQVTFSQEYSNLLSSNYDKDATNYKNCAFVFGEGEGAARRMRRVWRDDSRPTGLDLYEVVIDARDLSSNNSDGTKMSDEEYGNNLTIRGRSKLAESNVVETFDGEIAPDVNYEYKKDYFLGDLVTIENEYGISRTVRITAVTECEDANGYYYIPTYTTEV